MQAAAVRATQVDALTGLARTLLRATSVDDVLANIPMALGELLDPALSYQVVRFGPAGRAVPQPDYRRDMRLCVPLRCDGQLLGAIVISAPSDAPASLAHLDADLIVAASELVATAIVAREQLATEQARQLQEVAELRFDAVSMLSHEMRTPLASIKGYATALLLEDVEWDASTRGEFLEAIDEESDHLTRLIEDILETAALEAGALRIEPEPILIPPIVKRVVDRLAIQSGLHRVVLSFPPEFPVVEADAKRIEQVLMNLLDNAVKYSPDGGLIVVRGETRPGEVVISVVDQGVGIAPEDLNQLFERFFRASPGRRRRIVGTGLGLPISEAIVRAHDGRIWAESRVGSGTTLSFTLPRQRSGTKAADDE